MTESRTPLSIRFVFAVVTLFASSCVGQLNSASPPRTVRPLSRAHAHNDYAHARPLLDALEHGFCKEQERWVGIDGRPTDFDSDAPAHLLPWISDSWSNHFHWNGRGEMPAEESAKLRSFVARAHQRGRRLRFWAAPDRQEAWAVLAAADVDLINTDNLPGLAKFLEELPGK